MRVIDSLQLTEKFKIETPVGWTNGGLCMIANDVQAGKEPDLFPKGFITVPVPSKKAYIRMTPQPE